MWNLAERSEGWIARILDVALPRFCLACGERLHAPRTPLLLCRRCRGRLEPVEPARSCPGCLRPLPAGRAAVPWCGACALRPPRFVAAGALWRYRPPLDSVLRAFKFGGLDFLGESLAAEGVERASRWLPGGLELAVPVPLPWLRRLRRGYNQAERFARPLARRLGLGFGEPLARPGLPPPQSALGRRDRRANARGTVRVTDAAGVAGRRILLVDDVLTTGATVRAAADVLVAAGARSVHVLVAAWTPPDTPPEGPSGALFRLLDSPCTRS